MRKLLLVGFFLATVHITGCALAPGQHVDTGELNDKSTDIGSHVNLVPITPKSIAVERALQQQRDIPRALLDYEPPIYRIGPGDTLYITVWEHPELTSPAGAQQQTVSNGRLVRPDGTLYYPYVGTIDVDGMTIEQLRAYIASEIAAYIEQPQVDVNIIEFASKRVWLNGAFDDPGTQAITNTPLTLSQALGKAHPNAEEANLSNLILARDGMDYHLDINQIRHGLANAADIYLKPGDRIFLPYNDHHQIYLLGEVNRPRALPFRTAYISLAEALGEAGGLDQTTSKGKAVYVIRGVEDLQKEPATVYQLDAKSPAAFVLAHNFDLHAGDIVFVGASGVTRWNRFLNQLLPFTAILRDSARTRNDFN